MKKIILEKLWEIKSFNFTCYDGEKLMVEDGKAQIDLMVEKCGINTVNFAFGALQEHTYSTDIDWKGSRTLKEDKLSILIKYAKAKGLRTIVKPMVNVKDGYWRGFIHFFDEDVPCEPKWSDWFKNYTDYMVSYGKFCEKEKVDMIIIGCEMVSTDHRSFEWRKVISKLREVYSGLLTYNCDKYQEHNVSWWDALDVISASGYYPFPDWDKQIERIKAVVDKFDMPFFFSETGCPSTEGARVAPNDWNIIGTKPVSEEEQAEFFRILFKACEGLEWHYGFSIWDWNMSGNKCLDFSKDGGYSVLGKEAEKVIYKAFTN